MNQSVWKGDTKSLNLSVVMRLLTLYAMESMPPQLVLPDEVKASVGRLLKEVLRLSETVAWGYFRIPYIDVSGTVKLIHTEVVSFPFHFDGFWLYSSFQLAGTQRLVWLQKSGLWVFWVLGFFISHWCWEPEDSSYIH